MARCAGLQIDDASLDLRTPAAFTVKQLVAGAAEAGVEVPRHMVQVGRCAPGLHLGRRQRLACGRRGVNTFPSAFTPRCPAH